MASVVSSVAGLRTAPLDSYIFLSGTDVTFQCTFTQDGKPTTVDTLTQPVATILEPMFLNKSGSANPVVLATILGTLTPGQQFEYSFTWSIPADIFPNNEYIVSYSAVIGGFNVFCGDEFFSITSALGQVGLKTVSYATVTDVRMQKMNIDSYLPDTIAKDVDARNAVIDYHLKNASNRLREELNLHRARGNTENYRLFCVFYSIYTILLGARGEDGSSISDQNILYWRTEADRILAQEKRRSIWQGIPAARS